MLAEITIKEARDVGVKVVIHCAIVEYISLHEVKFTMNS